MYVDRKKLTSSLNNNKSPGPDILGPKSLATKTGAT